MFVRLPYLVFVSAVQAYGQRPAVMTVNSGAQWQTTSLGLLMAIFKQEFHIKQSFSQRFEWIYKTAETIQYLFHHFWNVKNSWQEVF